MSEIPTIHIDLNQRCMGCGKKGTLPNGFCLECLAKRLRGQKPAQERRSRPRAGQRKAAGAQAQGSLFGRKAR